jgi:hypothetical protein
MKVNFTQATPYTPKWRKNNELPVEEQFQTVLKPLDTDDLLLLMDAIGNDPQAKVDMERMKKMLKEIGHLIPKYVTITNLEDGSGPVTNEHLIKFPFYMDLAAELVMQLAVVSMPTDADVKN